MKTTKRQAVRKHGDLNKLPADLLAWFDRHGRDLPWRTALGERRDPYRVWLAEIMLQQTTIPHGTPYFMTFTQRWPTVEALAAAKDEEVMTAWAGLGYYARARNLLKCAREIAARGSWPETAAELRRVADEYLEGKPPWDGDVPTLELDEMKITCENEVSRAHSAVDKQRAMMRQQARILLYTKNLPPSLCDR